MKNLFNSLLFTLGTTYSFILPNNLNPLSSQKISNPMMSSQDYLQSTSNKEKINFNYKNLMDLNNILVQGGSLRTWSYKSPLVEQVQVTLSSEGRPIDGDVELWHGPDNTPCKMRIYIEDGLIRPFTAVLETPRGPNTVAIKNIGQVEFPLTSYVTSENIETPNVECLSSGTTIQGGALKTYPFNPLVDSVQVLLRTDGRPLNSRIELLQGPNNNKQVIEFYSEDGCDRPFFCIIETPGSGNVIRVVNTAPIEFPMLASVVPYRISNNRSSRPTVGGDVVMGGNVNW
jgi:hypothetical protein